MSTLLCLSIAMAVGLLLTRFAKLINLPNVTAFLVAGLLIGPSIFNIIDEQALGGFQIITTVALGLIAFSIGGEFKLSHIKQLGGGTLTITFLQSFGAVILVDLTLWLVGTPLPLALILGAIAAATAPAATLMVVRQYKAKGPVTSTLLPVVAIDDAIALVVFAISLALAKTLHSSSAFDLTQAVLKPLLEIVLALAIGAALGLILVFSTRFFKSRANRICIIIACVLAGVGLSELLGLSSLLVCMTLGAIFANMCRECERVFEALDRWTPPIFMLFFVISGAGLDISVIPSVGLVGIVYLIARSIGKYAGSFLGAEIAKAPPTVKKYLGIALLPQAGVAIGLAALTVSQFPEYGNTVTTVVLCATLIYELLGPVLTRIALKKAGEIQSENS